jgi:methyl-accepting chemotaxis protein
MAVTIDTAMNELGAGGTNVQDFLQALTASLKGGVGPAKKFGGESSEEKKKAEEQLKKMEELSDGLEELTETLKDIQKVIKDTKDKAKSTTNDFKNLSSAINRLADNMKSGGTGVGDKKTFDNLNKMAKEAVTGHSLHVHDFTVAHKMDTIINEVRILTSIMGAGKRGGKSSKTKSVSDTSVGSSSGLGSATGLGATDGIGGGDGVGTKALNTMSTESRKIYDGLLDQAEQLGKKFGLSADEMRNIVELTAEQFGYDEKILLNVEKALKHKGHMAQYDRKILENAIANYRALDKTTATLYEQKQAMKEIGVAAQVAGHRMEVSFADVLSNIQNKLNKVSAVLNMLSPSNFSSNMPRINFDQAELARNSYDTMQEVSQLTMTLGGPIGDITNQIGTWQHSMYESFMTARREASELMMTQREFIAERLRMARRGFRTEQDSNDQARIGLGLGRMIGANLEQSSDELATWRQSFNLSTVQARILSTQVQAVGRATGVTGDNLLAAVKSARALAEQMRNTGSLTTSANETLIRFSATARRMGTEQVANPLMQAMGNFDPRSPLAPLLLHAAQRGNVSNQDVMNSNIIGNPQNERAMVTSLVQLRDEMRTLRDTTSLAAANMRLQALGYTQGLGAFELAVETLEDTVRTVPERITRLQGSITENTTTSERNRIAQEIAQLQSAGGLNNLAVLQQMAGRINQRTDGGGVRGMGALGDTDRNSARGAIANMANELAEHLDFNALRQRGIEVRNVEELQDFAMQSGRNFNEVIEALSTLGQTRAAAGDRSRDPMTQLREAIVEFQNNLQGGVGAGIVALHHTISANTFVGAGLTAEITRATIELAEKILGLGIKINELITALGINSITGFSGALGALAAAGGPLALLTAAATGAYLVFRRWQGLNEHHDQMVRDAERNTATNTATREAEANAIRTSSNPDQLRTTTAALDAEIQTQNVLMDRLQNQIRGASLADDIAGRTRAWRAEEQGLRTGLQQLIDNAQLARDRLAALNAARPAGAAPLPMPAPRVDLPAVPLASNERILTAEEAAQRGLPALPAGDAHIERAPTRMENLENRFRTGMTRVFGDWGFAEGTREIKNTGLAVLHQGEMVVPQGIAKHLGAEGTGPFQDSVALVRPAGNDALMQRRVQTEFAGTDSSPTMRRANTSLDEISASNNEQVDLMRQELAVLRQLLTVLYTYSTTKLPPMGRSSIEQPILRRY